MKRKKTVSWLFYEIPDLGFTYDNPVSWFAYDNAASWCLHMTTLFQGLLKTNNPVPEFGYQNPVPEFA